MTATTVSPARLLANQQNALKSTGPKTAEGKERSRANAVKHGLTGEGVALPAQDSAEVERLQRSLETELKPSGVLGRTLVRRMALMAVRMDRCVDQESAHLAERVRQALADFDAEWPEEEGEDIALRAKARLEAAQVALFDPSKEACLARKYEAAAERCFFRSLKELRQVESKDSGNPSLCGRALPKTKARVGQQSRGLDRLGVRFSCRATTCPSPGRRRHCPTRASSRG